ncbi:MAG TPA: FAD-dependent oxidoreductase, partial [Tepidisphaeraceae bacterium]|nr:FAD-dependent oxidoreductase [Tepidisphaeraceae bacterium]
MQTGVTPAIADPLTAPHPDVCVVGAGIAGLTTAYLALKAGRSVTVLDMGAVGDGQTGRTTAHLASAVDDRFHEIERLHGVDGARAAYESNAAAIDMIERIAREENIDCDFHRLDGLLFPAASDSPDVLDKELAAAHRAGFTSARIEDSLIVGTQNHGRHIRFPDQGRFHPLKYLVGLAGAIRRMRGIIHSGAKVIDVQPRDDKANTPPKVVIEGGRTLSPTFVVIASNAPGPIGGWVGGYTKVAPYRTYVVALKAPRDTLPDVLWWDDEDPYHYVRLERTDGRADTDVLIVGGEDHKTGQFPADASPFMNLELWARRTFAGAGDVVARWSGQVLEPADGLPFIGHAPDRPGVFVITGDSGQGMTHGTLGGMITLDLIRDVANPWARFYDPARKT